MNNGKTTLVTKYINYVRSIAEQEGREINDLDIMYFETPVRVTFKQMFASLLGTKFGMPIKGSALIRTEAKKAMGKYNQPTVKDLLSDSDLSINTPEGAKKVLKYMEENGLADLDNKTHKMVKKIIYENTSSSLKYAKVIISFISALLNFFKVRIKEFYK